MWLVSFKVARKKMQEYSSKKQKVLEAELDIDVDDPLPILPPHLPRTYQECNNALDEWEFCIPQEFSSPSRKRYKSTITASKIDLGRASLQ
jgi:hypothetical protein